MKTRLEQLRGLKVVMDLVAGICGVVLFLAIPMAIWLPSIFAAKLIGTLIYFILVSMLIDHCVEREEERQEVEK